jgi:hypothetical protein
MMPRNDTKSGQDSDEDETELLIDRRSYLLAAGAAVGSVGLFSGRASAAFERHGIAFKRTVNMVEDAGCDPTGNEPCNEKITEAVDDYTLLKFPPGEYKLTDRSVVLGATNLGFVGEGDVRFTVPANFNEKVLIVDDGTGVLFENIDLDLTADGATPGLHLGANDDLEVHDVEFIGQGIHPDSDPRDEGGGDPSVTNAFTPIVRSSDGTGRVTNVTAENAGLMGAYNGGDGRVGVWIGISHQGTIELENCHIEGFPNNGLYCSRTYGAVQVEGGVFRNNDITQVRLSSRDSYVKNAAIQADFNDSESPNPEDVLNSRGVRFEAGRFGSSGASVENCDIAIIATPNSDGGVVVGNDGANHAIDNSRIGIDVDGVRGVYAKPPTGYGSRPPPPEPHTLAMRGVSITGTAAGNEAVRIDQRFESSVADCCIHQDGADRAGVKLVDSTQNTVKNATIDVPDETVIAVDCEPTTTDIATDGTCPTPDYAGETDSADDAPGETLTIEGAPGADYELAVSGTLEKSNAMDATIDPNDELVDAGATGQVGGGGRDSYRFTGEITRLVLDGGANLYYNGESVDPAEYLKNTVTVESQSYAEYELTTSDGIVKSAAMGAADPNDDIDGRTATGHVGEGGIDSYAFPGKIENVIINGEATVYRNGEEIDTDQFGPNVLTIESETWAEYELAVNSDLEKAETADPNDKLLGSSVVGQVGEGGRDSYAFLGEITRLILHGGASLYYNGEQIDPAEYLKNTVSIESESSAEYEITTSDGIVKSAAMGAADPNDDIDGRTATGHVGEGGIDSYAYPGEIVGLDIDGEATVYCDGSVLRPERLSARDSLPLFGRPRYSRTRNGGSVRL